MALHREGLVRSFGVSNMGHAQIAALQDHLDVPLVANQLEMSLHRRDWLEAGVLVNVQGAATGFPLGTIEHCRRHDIELQAWGALAQGRYTGRAETAADRRRDGARRRAGGAPRDHAGDDRPLVAPAPPRGDRARHRHDERRPHPRLRRRGAATARPRHEEWYALWVAARGAPLP